MKAADLGNSYRTPTQVPKCILQRLLGWTRWPAHIMLHHAVWACSRRIEGGILTAENFSISAWQATHQLESCGAVFEVDGIEHLRALEGPAIVIGNHMSLVETLTMPAFIIDGTGRHLSFVVKNALFSYPSLGKILKGIHAIGVGRTNPKDDFKAVMDNGQEILKSGQCMTIFPQATRSAIFNPEHFNTIGVKLARAAGVPVVPMTLKSDIFENGSIVKDLGPVHLDRTIHFRFGKPMQVSGNGRAEHQQIVEFIKTNLREWGGRIAENEKQETK